MHRWKLFPVMEWRTCRRHYRHHCQKHLRQASYRLLDGTLRCFSCVAAVRYTYGVTSEHRSTEKAGRQQQREWLAWNWEASVASMVQLRWKLQTIQTHINAVYNILTTHTHTHIQWLFRDKRMWRFLFILCKASSAYLSAIWMQYHQQNVLVEDNWSVGTTALDTTICPTTCNLYLCKFSSTPSMFFLQSVQHKPQLAREDNASWLNSWVRH